MDRKNARSKPQHLQRPEPCLLENARPAWPLHYHGGADPETLWDLVEQLKIVACNRLDRIRQLEAHVANLCELRKRI